MPKLYTQEEVDKLLAEKLASVRTKDLTDDEIHELVLTWENHALARAVIAKFKEKNK